MNKFVQPLEKTKSDITQERVSTRLESEAIALAKTHSQFKVTNEGVVLVAYLDEIKRILDGANNFFSNANLIDLTLSVAAEWMLDNDYLIQQTIRQVKEDLPKKFYHELPKLTEPVEKFYFPRVYDLVTKLIHREQGQFSPDRLEVFIHTYQQINPLRMGEIWAIPSLLRLGILYDLTRAVTELIGQPREEDLPTFTLPPLTVSADKIIANSISSLRILGSLDWKVFFEKISITENILRDDPANIYARMDFETRDRYRKRIEEIAAQSNQQEWEVARVVIRLAQAGIDKHEQQKPRPDFPTPNPSADNGVAPTEIPIWANFWQESFTLPRDAHIGYYLLDAGLPALEKILQPKIPLQKRILRWLSAHPTFFYLGSVLSVVALILGLLIAYIWQAGGSWSSIAFLTLIAAVPISTFAIQWVNVLVTRLISPLVLPKMDFSEEIPGACSTLVVIPALLTSEREVDSLHRQIELHYLRNPKKNLYFGLLTDLVDARAEKLPEDARLVERVQKGIQDLNNKYSGTNGSPFFLFHRPRRWNPGEGVWMGWERKRGKLHELNRLILGHQDQSFANILGDVQVLTNIRYVITLDADTILPQNGAHRLVATLAHPLNRAEFDPQTQRVIAGYTILQPRTEILPSRVNQTLFTQIFTKDTGLDLYTLAVSDVYQDLFGEGIFVGKGIYEVASFERSLEGLIPENSLLSHDLFEGIHGRTALVTDVVILEDYPPNYLVEVQRAHRWVRGDWQLIPWLLGKVPSASGKRIPNRLEFIDRWKIIDNLRRSLLAPALLLFFVAGWISLPGSPLAWTLFGLSLLGVPTFTSLIDGMREILAGTSPNKAFLPTWHNLLRWLLAIIFLPFEAMINLDAILTTLLRLFIERRGLLQWITAAQVSRRWGTHIRLAMTWRQMITVFLLSTFLALALALLKPTVLWVASPILLLWVFSPQVAYLISRVSQPRKEALTPDQEATLRVVARLTWFFFEQFMRPEDHWLPPDHFQEDPRGAVAHRTSPTNIGLGMLSALAAHDFGYIETVDFVARLRATFETLDQLEQYRGHFLNWYDTRTLAPLHPRYISTVDSGNMAACLIALAEGCKELIHRPLLRRESWQGLADTINIVNNVLLTWLGDVESQDVKQLSQYLTEFCQYLQTLSGQPEQWLVALQQLSHQPSPAEAHRFSIGELEGRLMGLLDTHGSDLGAENLRRLRIYTKRVHIQLDGIKRQMDIFLPWLEILRHPPQLFAQVEQDTAMRSDWGKLVKTLQNSYLLSEIQDLSVSTRASLNKMREWINHTAQSVPQQEETLLWLDQLQAKIESATMDVKILMIGLQELAGQCEKFAYQMDFTFLFDTHRKVFHLGYNLELDRLDNNYYDLLASEARIASLFAIAKGDVPQTHWLHLGRPVTRLNGTLALVSWSATMFEYLMPPLLMRNYQGTLLDQSAQAAVEHQIQYGAENNVPWGISESGYFRFDNHMNYQYRAFGVPGLGFKRGLEDDLVIAPYASFLSLPFNPTAVVENYERLKTMGMLGTYGLYEAIDFTKERLPSGDKHAIVRSFMSHHQGMVFIALTNALHNQQMVNRFHSNPYIQSVELLLQEQIPTSPPLENTRRASFQPLQAAPSNPKARPWLVNDRVSQPRPHLISNGHYSVFVTQSGGGFSRWQDIDLTRWRPDTTLDSWGTWFYVQDIERPQESLRATTYQPTAKVPESYQVEYYAHKAMFRRRDGDISLVTEITVPPGEDLEIRRITLTNHSESVRRLQITSYAEIALAPQSTDERHPAFNKLFIESDWSQEMNTLFFRRRPRKASDEPIFYAHALVLENGAPQEVSYESDRSKFLGRGGTPRQPQALLQTDSGLTNTVGSVLDPVASISCSLSLQPHQSIQVAFLNLTGNSQKPLQILIQRFQHWYAIERAFDQANASAELELRRLGVSGDDLPYFQRLLSVLAYPHRALRPPSHELASNTRGQSGLWRFGISGDFPILLVTLEESDDLQLVQEVMKAHAFWRGRQFKVDVVLINEQGASYGQELTGQLHRLISLQKSEAWLNRNGGIFILYADQLDKNDRTLLFTVAKAVLEGRRGSLSEQLHVLETRPSRLPMFVTGMRQHDASLTTPIIPRPAPLQFDNGLGGGSPDGREYVIYLENQATTPLPWINVIANEDFGFIVTEGGSSFTWAKNSGENRLTPWNNDPITDTSGEAIYLRDEETAEIWTPTPLPVRAPEPYLIRHGAGYTIFEHNSHGLNQQLRMFVSPTEPVKIIQLRLENLWERPRRITATYYAEWVLGVNRTNTQSFIIPEYDDKHQALLARNPYNEEFANRVAFVTANKTIFGLTADRTEFLGRRGSYQNPLGIRRVGLAGVVEAGADPCAVIQLHLDLPAYGSEEIYFLLGEGDNREDSLQLIQKFKNPEEVTHTWEAINAHWDQILDTVRVQTPDPGMNFLLNRWLLYQALSCRIWGRSAFYQSSGAFGFRDQLQDVMSLMFSVPEITRNHIVLAARHQFEAGDVLHWWHPPSGRGVRTRMSDDLLWLPFVTAHYVQTTGDYSILEEKAPFRMGDLLQPDEEERYSLFGTGSEDYSILEHCYRALNRGMTSGPHGLPLIGTGDWNDGMNRVGVEGRGESIWMAWFLNLTLKRFAEVCETIGNVAQATIYRDEADRLIRAVEEHAWDGNWYLRAFYDDGSPLGSAQNRECQIDSLGQSWAVFSGDGDPDRASRAMQSVLERLVRLEDRLILLFTPPFDKTPRDPGYIRGYLPGIRENGGQYTHAAIWAVWAFAELGDGDQANELFNLLNPIYHSNSPEKMQKYKVEPYVIAADVYGVVPHTGRGGWTWYTGSSGWMYRLGVEAILGLRKSGDRLQINPCIPTHWEGFQLRYRHGNSIYEIQVTNPEGVSRGVKQVMMDGTLLADLFIPLKDDAKDHQVVIELGKSGE